ncbi:MAG TPA: hypothetical protein VM369_02580 [Candidatus Binatia bacterium]|nr:hypothetical protein [Candidatus Binatia bacterium]
MKIGSTTRVRALCDILERRLRIWGISAQDLQRAWLRTGLRYSDLDHALRELLSAGMLRVKPSASGRRFYLAPGRELRAPAVNTGTALADRMRLLRMKLRGRTVTPSTSLRRRRTSDPV